MLPFCLVFGRKRLFDVQPYEQLDVLCVLLRAPELQLWVSRLGVIVSDRSELVVTKDGLECM